MKINEAIKTLQEIIVEYTKNIPPTHILLKCKFKLLIKDKLNNNDKE